MRTVNYNKTNKQAFFLILFAFAMLAMSYAAVPLYKIFCQVTGFGGTPQLSDENNGEIIKDKINVRFDSTI